MLAPLFCRGCGQRLTVPDGHSRSKLRCVECGVFNDLPKDVVDHFKNRQPSSTPSVDDDAAALLRDEPPVRPKARKERAAIRPAPAPPAPAPPEPSTPPTPPADDGESETYGFAPADPSEPQREILIEGTTEDDGKAYQVTGDIKRKKCPECEKRIDYRAKVCTQCGYNFATKEKAVRDYTPIIREWETGWPLQRRVIVFGAAQLVNFAIFVLSLMSDFSICVGISLPLITAAIQAFLLGTFDTLKIIRNNKGKTTITRAWRFCFLQKPPDKIKWHDHEGVVLIQTRELELVNWIMCLILLGYGILPGVLFWWFVIRPDQFHVALSMSNGYPETTLYKGTNEAQAREILQVVMDVTGLKDNR